MQSTQKSRWLVDAALFTGFILAFLLDLTGLIVHQWLGLAVFALAAYHLFDHDSWVTSITRRFFGKLAARSRFYYLLDAALMVGFITITVTGLIISSWLNLLLAGYDAWLFVHIAASIATLLVTVLKLALHWRWIVLVTKNIFTGQSVLAQLPAAGPALVGRREFVRRRDFIRLMGVVGIGSTIALASSIKSLRAGINTESSAAAANSSSISQSSASAASSSASTSSTCSVRCRKGCAFPGRCRKYVDTNSSGRCDLGECA